MTDEMNPQNQPEELNDWDFPELGTQDEEKKKKIKLFAPNIYFVKCTEYKITRSPRPNQFTGEHDINCTWKFEIIKAVDNQPVKYNNGEVAEFTSFPVWTNVEHVASTKEGKPQATRAIMTALMGIPSNAKIGKPDPANFIGKYARVVCEVGTKKNGDPKQLWSSWASWDGK